MISKSAVAEQLEEMPDEFSLDELIGKLILIEKINMGLKDIENGRVVTESELESRMLEWFK